jgi:hypothetical protein
MEAPRQGLGTFFRTLMDFVDKGGLHERVRAAVSPATREVIDNPPRPLTFIPSRAIDEIEAALQRLAGTEALVECGLVCSRSLAWSLIQPVLRLVFQLFGQSAEPVFANLDKFFSLVTKGITFSWERQGDGGTVVARFDGPDTPEAAFHVLRGTLLFVFEVTGTRGEVAAPEIVHATNEGATVRYRVQWR